MVHVKSEKEIDLMREPCKIVRDTLDFVGSKIQAGMSTLEVNELVERYIRASGANPSCLGYGGFPASACISVNEMVVHGIPNGRILQEGDIVSVDVVADKNGYHGDACRTYCIGSVAPEVKELVKVTEECFFKAIEGLQEGTPLFNIGYAVQQHAEAHGYGVIRSYTGHGIGREMHEDPQVPNFGRAGYGPKLEKGLVLAIEPMITLGDWQVETLRDGWTCVTVDRSPSAHYENTVALTENGIEILTL